MYNLKRMVVIAAISLSLCNLSFAMKSETPHESVHRIVTKRIGAKRLIRLEINDDYSTLNHKTGKCSHQIVLIHMKMQDMRRWKQMKLWFSEDGYYIVRRIFKDDRFASIKPISQVTLFGYLPFVDRSGKESLGVGFKASLSQRKAKNYNWKNIDVYYFGWAESTAETPGIDF